MADDFDRFVEALQAEIDADVRLHYSPNALDLIKHEPHHGSLPDCTAEGTAKEASSESMTFFVKIDGTGRIDAIGYETTGCKPALACASQLALLAKGKMVEVALSIDGNAILKAIGRFPAEHQHYADLAVSALQEALKSRLMQDP
jgi:NifU-like protein involved in Fe-S cluster formation